MPAAALILFAHGSRDPRWARPFQRLAFMEFAAPTLMEVAGELTAAGQRSLRLLPLFLAGGAHVASDIPAQVREVQAAHPGLEIEVLAPLGEHPRFYDLMKDVARDAATG